MTPRPTILVGLALPALVGFTFCPDESVIFIEEPDIVRKRDLHAKVKGAALVRELIELEYQLPGAADEFYNSHRDLDPVVVMGLMEYAVPFAARLAERYGVRGATFGAAELLRDKAQLRKATRGAGIANPVSRHVDGPDAVREFMRGHPGKIVLKPANRQGAVGTEILSDPAEVDGAWARCIDQDEGVYVPDRGLPLMMLAEQFVEGHEYSVEMMWRDGARVFGTVTDKILYPGPRPVEEGHIAPADIPDELKDQLLRETERVCDAVGLGTAIVHCEWIVSDGTPYLVECAGRLPGDAIPNLVEAAYGLNVVHTYYRMMAGEELEPMPTKATQAAAIRFLQVEPGIVESVEGVEEAKALGGDGIVYFAVSVEPGDRMAELRSSWDRHGMAAVKAPTPAEADQLAKSVIDCITVKVRPVDD
ncbi:MAG: ATP-grasp domain-containing protein [Frankiaceae bacterium]